MPKAEVTLCRCKRLSAAREPVHRAEAAVLMEVAGGRLVLRQRLLPRRKMRVAGYLGNLGYLSYLSSDYRIGELIPKKSIKVRLIQRQAKLFTEFTLSAIVQFCG